MPRYYIFTQIISLVDFSLTNMRIIGTKMVGIKALAMHKNAGAVAENTQYSTITAYMPLKLGLYHS